MNVLKPQLLSHQLVEAMGMKVVDNNCTFLGDIWTEAELAAHYDLSRVTVREAVKILSSKGLIKSTSKVGIQPLPMEDWNFFDYDVLRWLSLSKNNQKFAIEFAQLWQGVFCEATALATHNCEEEQIIQLAALADKLPSSTYEKTISVFIAITLVILTATNNRFFIQLKKLVPILLKLLIRKNKSNEKLKQLDAGYIRVCQDLCSRDVSRAKRSAQYTSEAIAELQQAKVIG